MVGSAVSVTPAVSPSTIMLFARTPVVGQVKTRLIPHLGAQRACRLHRSMLEFGLQQLQQTQADELQLWLSDESRALDSIIPQGLSRHRQQGADLGSKMAYGFAYNFTRGSGAVIVAGSDCPQLVASHYHRALLALEHHDAVIIPALDGGYVLLGLRRFEASLFTDIPWGQASVYQKTTDKLVAMDWRWCALEPLADIDRPEDLVHLRGIGLEY
jgi:hypothetical protein